MSELNSFCFMTNLFITVLCGGLLPFLPMLTRKSFLFGVKVPPAENDGAEARALKARYVAVCAVGAAVVLAADVAQYLIAPDMTLLAVMYFPLLFVAVQFAAFVPQHNAALRLKRENGWVVSEVLFADTKSAFTRGKLSHMPWGWYIAALLVVFATAAALLARYPSMPDVIVTHYGLNMEPNAWADKTIARVLTTQIINLATLALLWATGLIIERGKLQIDSDKPALSFAQHSAYRRRMGHAMGFLALGIAVMVALADMPALIDGFRLNTAAWMMITIVPTVVLCVVAIGAGQGGCRIKIDDGTVAETAPKEAARRGAVNDRGDDRLWALGLFYHNPDDPAIFVEDRFGTNFGLNYGRLSVKIGAALFGLAIVATYVVTTAWLLGKP